MTNERPAARMKAAGRSDSLEPVVLLSLTVANADAGT